MSQTVAWTLPVAILFGSFVGNLRAEITAEQVRRAIDRGVSYLRQHQKKDGSWPEWVGQPGGLPALCTLAMLNAGVPPEDPDMQRALAWLRKQRLETTYAVALQTMVFCKAEPQKDLLLISRNARWIEKNQIAGGPRKGAWAYPQANGDNSNSQFALLALHEAERAGVDIRGSTWRLAKAYWEDCQNPDGSWGYYKGLPGTGSMTCAGIASLIITTGAVHRGDARAAGDKIFCCGQGSEENERIERAMQWLVRNFTVSGNPGTRGSTWAFYYLYGVERVGRLTARRFIGNHDWYREGADHLIHQGVGGANFWKGRGHAENNELIATSLALLFLSKGRRPVLMAKLEHGPKNDWNQHRGDVAHLTRYVEGEWKRDLTWQVVNVQAATVEDLLQSPVLYFAGSASPLPPSEAARLKLARKLRDYLDRGGFVFAEAYCGGEGFDGGFRRLMELAFPEPEYRLALLPPEHPIWRAERPVDPEHLRPLWGIEFGCRTSVVYAPAQAGRPSLSCLWELAYGNRDEEYSKTVRERIDAAETLGINILAYATNRELKGKEEGFRIASQNRVDGSSHRGSLEIAGLRHPGGCNAAPRALVNLLQAAADELKIPVNVRRDQLGITDEALFDYPLAFMHGRNSFRLTAAERKRLHEYIERGGVLFANSICASRAFTESFRREMAAIFPDRPLEKIPVDDPLLTTTYGGFDLSTVTRRDPQPPTPGSPMQASVRKVPPALEGIKFDDRWGVIFSNFDISCALEKHASLECQGYIRQDAARIGLNVILYALQH